MSDFWPRAILHVDMDAFFASVEQLDFPELRGKPVAVGGSPEGRGVISAASYEARVFGVRSAMPTARALMQCPDLILRPGRMERYSEMSGIIQGIFHEFTPLVEPLSVDEAFLDITGCQRLFGDPEAIARTIKTTIRKRTGLTASVGIAPTKFVAKIASDLEKPDGLVCIRVDEVLDRLGSLPVGRLWGVGPKAEKALRGMGIFTIADLRAWPLSALKGRFGSSGEHLHALSHGIDPRGVETEHPIKSVSHETTFDRDVADLEELKSTLRYLADKVAARMRAQDLEGRVVCLKVRYDDFSTVTRRVTLKRACALGQIMADEAIHLMLTRTEAGARHVRLIGVGMADLTVPGAAVQSALFNVDVDDRGRDKLEAIERTADLIRARMGKGAIRRAIHVDGPKNGELDESQS